MNEARVARSEPISPIRVSANGRYFVDRGGAPVFWLGDTLWELFRLYTADEALELLERRRDQGFNVILVMLTGVDVGAVYPDREAPCVNLHGEAPWIGDDPLRPNEEYFRQVDKTIRLGEKTGQTLVVGVYHKWHVETITVEKARAWARWVAHRYRDAPNLIWSMYPTASAEFVPVCRELAAGLREGDGGAHLISVHPDPSVASSSFLHDEEWLAFNMIQTCIDYDRIADTVTADYRRTPTKPVVMAEGGYEGVEFDKTQTAHDIRKQAYWSQLAGGHHVYGHNDAWTSPSDWRQWIGAPGAEQLRVFKDVLTAREGWWDMAPDQSLLTDGAGSGYSLNMAARSAADDWSLVYLSEPCTVSLRPGSIGGDAGARAHWIDPRDGSRTPAGPQAPDEAPSFTSPQGWEDALLLVEETRTP